MVLERLMGDAPAAAPHNREREAAINHYRKILYLDPNDEGARASLKRLGVHDAAPAIGPGAAPRLETAPAVRWHHELERNQTGRAHRPIP